MKIKSDFVTNSSSTCYVVLVPTSFKASDSTIKDHYLQACIDAGQGDEDDITEDLMEKGTAGRRTLLHPLSPAP